LNRFENVSNKTIIPNFALTYCIYLIILQSHTTSFWS